MNCKVIFALAFAFLAVQVSAGAVVPEPRDLSDIITPVVQVVEKITALIITILDKLAELVGKYEDNYTEIHAKTIAFLVEQTLNANTLVLKVFDSIVADADEDGKKLVACVDIENPKARAFLNTSIPTLIDCLTPNTPEILQDGQKLIKDLSASVTKVTASLKEFETCTSGTQLCGLQFVNEVLTIVSDFVSTAKTDAAGLIEIVIALPALVGNCANDFLTVWKSSAVSRINDIAKCMS